MSKYTTEVRFIVETENGLTESEGYNSINDLIDIAAPKIFSNYPIFDENYRAILNRKILKHYYTREICEETVGLWKLRLAAKMEEIMPYYNQLYNSELLEFNPLYDVDVKKTGDREKVESGNNERTISGNEQSDSTLNEQGIGTTNSTSAGKTKDVSEISETQSNKGDSAVTNTNNERTTENSEQWDLISDTPQGALSNVKQGRYLSGAENVEKSNNSTNEGSSTSIENTSDEFSKTGTNNINNDSEINNVEISDNTIDKTGHEEKTSGSTEVGSKNINNVEDYFEHIIGKRGSATYSKMLMEFRETFLNIDQMIIDELKDLFFLLW